MRRIPLPALAIAVMVLIEAACGHSPTDPSATTGTSTTTQQPLTPARSLEGTWKTALPITFTYQTDACGFRQNVGQAQWHLTWVMTAVAGFTNVLDIEQYVSRGGTSFIGSCGLAGWVPPVSPTFLRAAVSGTRIAYSTNQPDQSIKYDGSFTTDLMELTYVHWECIVVCYGEYTEERALKLVRQP